MGHIVITTLKRSFFELCVAAIWGIFFGFIIAGWAFLSRHTEHFGLWFGFAFLDITAGLFLWWAQGEYLALKRGAAIAKRLAVPIAEVMWLSLFLNQFTILEGWTREEFLQNLREARHHRPHHPDCDEVSGNNPNEKRSTGCNPYNGESSHLYR